MARKLCSCYNHELFRSITERAAEVTKETAGKEDDKVYRGINNYAKYIDKKESLIGIADYYPHPLH